MLALALLIDAILGEPEVIWRRVPHPAVLMGRAIGWLEARLNRGRARRAKGVLAVAALVAGSLGLGELLALDLFGGVIEVILGAILLAQRSLAQHVARVAEGLAVSLDEGRRQVSMIVGRDPQSLDRAGVARAAIESAAENFSDGVVAPAFWFALLGLPGLLAYKAVNTADSMIGHLSDRYREFGWAAARLDDLLNWVPARMAGGILCLVGGGRAALQVMLRDADLHRSPNAGWPEAAMAASLGVALAGPRVYGGVPTDDPHLNPQGRLDAAPDDIRAAVRLIWRGWAVMVVLAVLWWGLGRLIG
ncbi:adenosylcobinamide-phosphate synthase CbiB [Limibaculum sp. FT325]|uniref:adenosylcobinamide-phosphate synthase CbiB n=1 Tax=Thermohalobaculum sediminis TaxID=2939436 RepID=UPI0020BF6ACC|nr:adenosylcobinamide-phosphate synthase CbiB [Limibaculum sediminis]MCL5775628.1 adenosylcobinamide-phosphate synthase CbiB [Limibaculum sediminis]